MSFAEACEVLSGQASLRNLRALREFLKNKDLFQAILDPHDALDTEERHWAIRLVTQMFTLYESPQTSAETLEVVDEFVPKLLCNSSFFPHVFSAVSTCESQREDLLKLVYQSLFSVIPDTSELVVEWFKQLPHLLRVTSRSQRALSLLVSVQFLNVGAQLEQNSKSYRVNAKVMAQLSGFIGKLSEPSIMLVWALVLHQVALRYMAAPDAEFASEFLEPILHVRDGVKFDFTARDMLLPALELCGHRELIDALEYLQASEQYSQTVADVLVALLDVTKPTATICRSLSSAISKWPSLQRDFWASPQARDALALTKAKCPAALEALVELALCVPRSFRENELDAIESYVDFTEATNIEVELGSDGIRRVRARGVVEIFPPRPSDGQGSLMVDENTPGILLSGGPKPLVLWKFLYSGWSLIGRIIESHDLEVGDSWDAAHLRLLELVTATASPAVLSAMSQGLSRGDIVELIIWRLESWLRQPHHTKCPLVGIAFVEAVAREYPRRVAALAAPLTTAVVGSGEPSLIRAVLKVTGALLEWPALMADVKSVLFRFVLDVWESFTYWAGDEHTDILRHDLLNLLGGMMVSDVVSELVDERAAYSLVSALTNQATLYMCSRLVEARRKFHLPLSRLEYQLYENVGEIVAQYSNVHMRPLILELLTQLVRSAPPETPLLAFLGNTASVFVDKVVTSVDDNLSCDNVITAASKFFAVVAKSHQQGLLVLLCSGKSETTGISTSEPLLPVLQSKVETLKNDGEALAAVLEALAALQPWVQTTDLNVNVIVDVIVEKAELENWKDSDFEVVAAGLDILSERFISKACKWTQLPASFTSQTLQLTRKFATVPECYDSLEERLSRGWASKWPQLSLDTSLEELDSLLSEDPAWPGYRAEIVEAREYRRLRGLRARVSSAWCSWLGAVTTMDQVAPVELDGCAQALLEANTASNNPQMNDLFNLRAQIAFVLAYNGRGGAKLVEVTVHQIAEPVVPQSTHYTLLRIVNCELRSTPTKLSTQLLLQILDVCVVRITRPLCAVQASNPAPDDMREILAALRRCLELLGGPKHPNAAPLCQAMFDAGSDRALTRLYSNTSEPEIGALALEHINEWLPVGIMADHFVGHGLLTVLVESPLSRKIQRGIPPEKTSLHNLWKRGILPVILRLVGQLGPRIAQEAGLFVEEFSPQIKACLEQWRSPQGRVSLALIEETILIHALLTLLRGFDVLKSSDLFPRADVASAIDHLSSHRKYLSTRVIDDETQVLDEMADLRRLLVA